MLNDFRFDGGSYDPTYDDADSQRAGIVGMQIYNCKGDERDVLDCKAESRQWAAGSSCKSVSSSAGIRCKSIRVHLSCDEFPSTTYFHMPN